MDKGALWSSKIIAWTARFSLKLQTGKSKKDYLKTSTKKETFNQAKQLKEKTRIHLVETEESDYQYILFGYTLKGVINWDEEIH